MGKPLALIGKKFGKLSVVADVGRRSGKSWWKVICDCGNQKEVLGASLTSKHTTSCGCVRKEKLSSLSSKHNFAKTSIYRVWIHIKERCLNPQDKNYSNYGGRGIEVCKEWQNDFMAFLRDVGEPPAANLSLDRIDNDKGYFPGNVRWASQKEQMRNTRRTIRVRVNGEETTLKEACAEFGLNYGRMRHYISTGKSFTQAMSLQLL